MAETEQSPAERITRGVLSRRAGCNIETVRYYERVGLMPDPERSEGGHRLYAEEHVRRLQFIRRCRELGFAVAEIRALLDLVDRRDYTCAEIRDITIALDTVTAPGTHATVVIDGETWSVDAIGKKTATMAILNLSRPATAKVTRRGVRT